MINDYDKYLDKQVKDSQLKERLSVDDEVFLLHKKNIYKAIVLKISEKSAKLHVLNDKGLKEHVKNYVYSSFAKKGDKVALVWEAWRGLDGLGGFRIEREKYEDIRIPIEKIPSKVYLYEENLGEVKDLYKKSYSEKINVCDVQKMKRK